MIRGLSKAATIKWVTRLVLLWFGLVVGLGLAEGLLRVYNPFESRVRGGRIVLPADKKYEINNQVFTKFDRHIVHTKNSLGFRGEEPPGRFHEFLTILTVGGSTTEDFYLSDGRTWTDHLGEYLQSSFRDLWINNAGLDGHSTAGHLILVKDYVAPMKPDVVIFLIGLNDVAREDLTEFDLEKIRGGIQTGSVKALVKSLVPYSALASLGVNHYRVRRAKIQGVAYAETDLKDLVELSIPPEEQRRIQDWHRRLFLKAYEERVLELLRTVRENGIEPVLITQPMLAGEGIDPETGVDLSKVRIGNLNGEIVWKTLEMYNDVLRKIGSDEDVLVIDLGSKLPKNSSLFSDFYHFTNEGAEYVAAIVYGDLCEHLAKKFNTHFLGQCQGVASLNQ